MVTAEKHTKAWTWTAHTGEIMQAEAGDWLVQDASGDQWSVRDELFRKSYEYVAENRWRRTGVALARPAGISETINTLEGPVRAAAGDWVVKGADGEEWPVPAERFVQCYERVEVPNDSFGTAAAQP